MLKFAHKAPTPMWQCLLVFPFRCCSSSGNWAIKSFVPSFRQSHVTDRQHDSKVRIFSETTKEIQKIFLFRSIINGSQGQVPWFTLSGRLTCPLWFLFLHTRDVSFDDMSEWRAIPNWRSKVLSLFLFYGCKASLSQTIHPSTVCRHMWDIRIKQAALLIIL